MWRLFLNNPYLILAISGLIIFSAYLPGFNGPLVFDDQLNIIENQEVAIKDLSYNSLKTAFLSNESGRLKRVLPALSFGINYYFAGSFSNTFVFKITNVAIHLINAALVFWLALLLWPRLLKSSFPNASVNDQKLLFFATFTAIVWALHPLQLTPVTYIVQRMTSMAGTFMLLGLCVFIIGRQQLEKNNNIGLFWIWFGIVGGTIFGLMCKENAALLPLYAGVIEYTVFSRPNENNANKSLAVFYCLTLFIPLTAGLIYCFIYPGNILNGFNGRPFSLAERLFTEARVLWFYLYMLVVPDITTMGLFHDDMPISKGWLTPWTTVISVFAWLITLSLAILLRKKVPVFCFAILWYLVGHSMESTFIPLKIIYEHRNYIPDIGPVFFIVFLGFKLLLFLPLNNLWLRNTLNTILVVIIIVGLYSATHARAEYWGSESSFIRSIAINHPLSPSSQYLYGELLYKKQRKPFQAYPYYFRAAQLEPDEVGYLISVAMVTPIKLIPQLKKDGYPLFFDPVHIAGLLKNKPVSAWGLRALDVAGKCVKVEYSSCKYHIHVVRKWIRAAIENKLIAQTHKRRFTNMLFDIEMKYALFDEALKTAFKAKHKDTTYYRYNFMLADVLAAKHQYTEALSVLKKTEIQFGEGNAHFKQNIQRLRLAIKRLIPS